MNFHSLFLCSQVSYCSFHSCNIQLFFLRTCYCKFVTCKNCYEQQTTNNQQLKSHYVEVQKNPSQAQR